MNKESFIIVLCIFALTANMFSQEALKQGSYSLSGSMSVSSSTIDSDYGEADYLAIVLTPSLSYFFVDNLSVGLNLSYGYYEHTWKSANQELRSIFRPYSIGPVIRYYFTGGTIIPFLEANYLYLNEIKGNYDGSSFSISGGINYFLTKSAALEPFAAYTRLTQIQADQKANSFSFGVRINYFIVD